MRKSVKLLDTAIVILFIFCFSTSVTASAAEEFNRLVHSTAEYIYKTVQNPQVSSIGGEWAVFGLARSEENIPAEYYQKYVQTVEEYVKSRGGVLHERKYTEYSRVILALTAIGKNPADIAGYNLLTPLGDYNKTIWQGINGPIWALIALDGGGYDMPQNGEAEIQATKEMYVDHILSCQLADGGWSLSSRENGSAADPDITAMALQALSNYQDNEKVKQAIEKALLCMSNLQNADGGFTGLDGENSESCAQMIVALCELKLPLDDGRFVKNGKTLPEHLLTYSVESGGFKKTYGDNGPNQMATEQCFCALSAVKRSLEGKSTLYHMEDVVKTSAPSEDEQRVGLNGKHEDVRKKDIIFPGKTFEDIGEHVNQTAIEALASRNIINGKSETLFDPNATMTRAEFAAVVTRGLGLSKKSAAVFSDVTENDWFFEPVNTAYTYGIVNGISETEFCPNGTITREEAAVMVARAAKLCGMNTEFEGGAARNVLAEFSDYVKASDWAIAALAFCYDKGILSNDVMEIKPKEAVNRAEIAQMLYHMLDTAKLL